MSGEINLYNTPGIYYAIGYFLSICLYIGLNTRKIHGIRLVLTQALFGVLIGTFMTLTHGVTMLYFVPCMIVDFMLLFLTVYVCADMSPAKALYFTVRAFILGEFAASFEWQIFYFALVNWGVKQNFAWNAVFLVVCHALVFGAMFLLESRHKAENFLLDISGRDLLGCCLIAIIVYAMSNISYVFNNTPFSSQFPEEIFIIRTLVDLSGVGMLYAYHIQLQELNVKLENEFLQKSLEMQYENYKMSEESIALVNQKYHDLKHQIAFLRGLDSEAEKNEYLNQMENEIKVYEAQNKTGNRVLDTILASKSMQCNSQQITLTCVADGQALDFMSPIDLSALFGNALDNAIESVMKIEEPEKRLIHLSVSKQKEFIRIKVENRYVGEIEFKNGLPATTKGDSRYHGFGIKSIKQIASKYNGSVAMDAKDGWFELRILLTR